MKIILDNGHGRETAGKCSPDGRLLEYAYTRELVRLIAAELESRGLDVSRLVPEQEDIPLKERVSRANTLYQEAGKQAILISVHVNAAGNGSTWFSARGWEAWTSIGNTKADDLASCLYEAAGAAGFKLRKDETDGDPDKEGHLYILKHTLCPAVLTENLFQDNREEVDFLLSDTGKKAIVDLHVAGIVHYLDSLT